MSLFRFVQYIQQQALHHNHRRMIRLQGDLSWCYQQATLLIEQLQLPYFWCGDAPDSVTVSTYKKLLGQETSLLLFNAHTHFDANAFAACEGTLRGGGLLVLITPRAMPENDTFYRYINSQLSTHGVVAIQQDHPIPETPNTHFAKVTPTLNLEEQQRAVAAIIKTVTGHRRRPLVLTANRGRGKSAALGIAAAQLLASGLRNILVCAPNKLATTTLFKHASLLLAGHSEHQFDIHKDNQRISFIAPDALIQELPRCDLLIIDEAAALPVPSLETIAVHYSRLVFATTLHGYEGSGRGFALRFQKRLSEISPQSRKLHLSQPIRWAEDDPIESFTLNKLCLTQAPFDNPSYQPNRGVNFNKLTTQQLISNHSLLQETFSLLVLAHYQTKPSDLEKLLNDPSLHIFVLRQQGRVLGVALINQEGDLEPSICEQIWRGERRVQGNLIAQSLTFHSGFIDAGRLGYARIQRIAIHPILQNMGLGSLFISHLSKWAKNTQFDHLCASFGATTELLSFWQQLEFTTLRVGLAKDSSSGTHSIIVNLPLSKLGRALHDKIQHRFHTHLPIQLSRHLREIDPQLILTLLTELKKVDLCDPLIDSYVGGNLPYEFAEPVLIKYILGNNLKDLSKEQQCLTIQKVLQNNSWEETCLNQRYTGKKQAQTALKVAITKLLNSQQDDLNKI